MSSVILSVMLLTLALTPFPHRAGAAAPGYGPILYLLSPTPAQMPLLPALPVACHATLWDKSATRYLASGDAAAGAKVAAAGIAIRVLDADTTNKVYYFVDATAPQARQLALSFGAVVYDDPQQLLLAVAQTQEASLVAGLPASGVPIALLSPDPLVFHDPAKTYQIAQSPSDVIPAVSALLPQVSEARLNEIIADLSGARPALIGGAATTITTRYTFAAGMTNAESYVRQRYTALGLTPVTLPWSYSSYSGRNIVADIRGVVHPERIWLVGGHLDSISETPYSTAPGADDNATGSAAALLLAEVLAGQRFADTIRFVHFTGEEQGMWGSKAYVRDLQAAGAQVMGYVDLDMIGWDGDGDRTVELHSGTASASIGLANAFIAANDRYGQGLRLELKQSTASRFSDHSSFWDTGYGAFLTIENFYDDVIPRDRNPWYHTSGDTLARVDLNYVARSARTALATMAELAGIVTGPLPTTTVTRTATPTRTATDTTTASATPTGTPTPTATATLAAGACTELLVNGGFETNTGWIMPNTAYPAAYTAARAYSGSRSLRAGVDAAPDRYSYSDAYQLVAIPANAAAVTLRAWWLPRSAEGALAPTHPEPAEAASTSSAPGAAPEPVAGPPGAAPEPVAGPPGAAPEPVAGPPPRASTSSAPGAAPEPVAGPPDAAPELVEGPPGAAPELVEGPPDAAPELVEGPPDAAPELVEGPTSAILQALADGVLPQGLLAGDRQYLLLLNTNGTILAVPLWTRADDAAWQPLAFDLTAYRGQTIQIRFGVYNDGDGQSTAMYLDDAALAACPSNVATATPTATPTATATATRTPTPSRTATVSPTRTLTASPTSSATPTPTRTPAASPTATRTPSPTGTATPSPTRTPTATATTTLALSPTATPTRTATTTRTPTPMATATPTPGACQELLVNGGFEANTGWIMPNTAYPAAYTTARAYSGSRSLRAGVDAAPDRYSYSDAYQLVAIPANAAAVTLRAWWLPRSADGALAPGTAPEPVAGPPIAILQALADGVLPQGLLAGDRQYLLLLNTSGTILAVPLWTRADAAAWQPLAFDLTAYRGQTIQIRFGVYNDGDGRPTALYLDDAALTACPAGSGVRIGQDGPVAFRMWMPLLLSGQP